LSNELEDFIQTSGVFITDLDEITTTLLQATHVFLYDTAAISNHENVFFHHNENFLKHFIPPHPILLTDVIAKEMAIGDKNRYSNYLSQFNKVLLIREVDFPKLLTDFYHPNELKGKFLLASEKAYADIQTIKHEIGEIRKHRFNSAESSVMDVIDSFFYAHEQKNRGELSLLWLSSVLEFLAPNLHLHFIGIDNDLYTYVHRCHLRAPLEYSKKARDIRISSNDTFLQGIHTMNLAVPSPNLDFNKYLDLYRNPDRNIHYFEKQNGIKSHTMKKSKFDNTILKNAICTNTIEIIY
jgi:hypothetical protein